MNGNPRLDQEITDALNDGCTSEAAIESRYGAPLQQDGKEPLPCPFCGGHPTMTKNHTTSAWWLICDDCGCEHDTRDSEAEAIAAWNRRERREPSPDTQRLDWLETQIMDNAANTFGVFDPSDRLWHMRDESVRESLREAIDAARRAMP